MQVDFFAKPCDTPNGSCTVQLIQCMQPITSPKFGISDIDGSSGAPARVVANPNTGTDFIVNNKAEIEVAFKAIDWCVPIYRTGTYDLTDEQRDARDFKSDSSAVNPDGSSRQLIKRCEGFLQFNNSIVFIEMKARPGGKGWVKDAREKFEETILSFKEHHSNLSNQINKPMLCNPKFAAKMHQNEMVQKRILKDKIGVDFVRQSFITI